MSLLDPNFDIHARDLRDLYAISVEYVLDDKIRTSLFTALSEVKVIGESREAVLDAIVDQCLSKLPDVINDVVTSPKYYCMYVPEKPYVTDDLHATFYLETPGRYRYTIFSIMMVPKVAVPYQLATPKPMLLHPLKQ